MGAVAKRILTGLAIGAAVIAAVVFAPPAAIPWAVAALALLAVAEYAALLRRKVRPLPVPGLLAGALVIVAGLSALPAIALAYGNLMLLYVLSVVKFSDVGGFAFGLSSQRLLPGGNHKLCPTVSPGKSWEGLLGSLVFSAAVSCAFMPLTHFGCARSLLLGAVAALVGTAGDLVESKFKRWVGVKDSSAFRWTNGLGGVLDMFDSLLFAPGVIFVLIRALPC